MIIILATLVDLPSPRICAKIQSLGFLGSGEEEFYGHRGLLGQWTATILALSFPRPKEAPHEIWAALALRLRRRSHLIISTFLLYKCIGKQTWPCHKKGQTSVYDHHFSYFGRPTVPDDLYKDSASKHRFWRRRFSNVFTIYGHSAILIDGQQQC